ncbi:MAG: succinate dehydrogenase cytochrome b subunit [Calditrichaeota bacterium]|nr:succinate dehydrogenase cytochrome b subunit [Calditrichota bacterium]
MALAGLFWILFLIIHLLGNLTILTGNPATLNLYSHKLLSTGPLLYFLEALLVIALVLHMIYGVTVFLDKRRARPQKYERLRSKGAPSKENISSLTMIYSGVLLFVFLVVHLLNFKYGKVYTVEYDGVVVRDLYRLVVETFHQPLYVVFYVVIMILLFSHLRHGFWSAFQSLGLAHPRYTPIIYAIGILLAIVLAVGYILLPIYVYFFVPLP